MSQQLTGLVADNEKELAPTLEKLNAVTAMLEKNRDNLAKALPGFAKYQLTQGETVSNGVLLQRVRPEPRARRSCCSRSWTTRSASGAVSNAGQPPDNAGPRAELPFPVNGIPQPETSECREAHGEPQP